MISTNIRSFIPIQKLGEGSFASVYKVKRISDQQIYALKKIKMNRLPQKAKENSLNEVRFLASFDSPYITKYYEAFFDENLDVLCIVMQYAEGGDLRKTINKHKKQKRLITQIEIWKAIIHLVFGLKILHDNKILHRDIKCQNILVSNETYKIGDMNVSKVNKAGFVDTQTGTPYYASPQVWKDQPYNQKSDIWSLGCIMYEMAALRPPFMGSSMEDLYKNVIKGTYPAIPRCYSNELSSFIEQCLKVNPEKRPLTSQLLKNPTLKIYENICLQASIPTKNMKVDMLQTICLPKNIRQLNSCLPKSNYQTRQTERNSNVERNNPSSKEKSEHINVIENYVISQAKQQIVENVQEQKPVLEVKSSHQVQNVQSNDKLPQTPYRHVSKIAQQSIKQSVLVMNHPLQERQLKMNEKISSYSKRVETSQKKKRRILREIQKEEVFIPLPKSRSKSLPRTQRKSMNQSKELASQTAKKEGNTEKQNVTTPVKMQHKKSSWSIIEQAKKHLQRSLKKNRRIL